MTKIYLISNDRLAKMLNKTGHGIYFTVQVFIKGLLRTKTTGKIIITRRANKPL